MVFGLDTDLRIKHKQLKKIKSIQEELEKYEGLKENPAYQDLINIIHNKYDWSK